MHIEEIVAVFVFLFVVLAVYAAEGWLLVSYLIRRLKSSGGKNPLLSKGAIALHIVAVVGAGCILYGRFVEPYRIEVTRVRITTDKLEHKSLRIVQLSDLHCESKPYNDPEIPGLVNALEPDVVVFTGDALNDPAGLVRFKQMLSEIEAPLGKFAVLGNIDIWHRPRFDLFGGTGFRHLDGRSVTVEKAGAKFAVTGCDCDDPAGCIELLEKMAGDKFNILLYHWSDLVEDVPEGSVDLYLAGHTHGGQIRLPIYGAVITLSKFGKKYEAGRYEIGDTTLYINRGIGFEGGFAPRVRFLCRPEITVFEIHPADILQEAE